MEQGVPEMKRCALLSLVVLGLLLVATNAQAGLLDRLAPCGSPCGACDEVAVDPCEAVIVDDCGTCGPCGGGILPLGILDRIRGLVDPCGACDPCGDPCGVCDEVAVDPCEAVIADDCGACGPCGGGILPLGIRDRIRDLRCDPCGAPCGTCDEVAVDPCEAIVADDCGACGPCGGGILPLGILDRLRGLTARCGACDPCGDPCGACDEVAVDPCEAVFADDCGTCGPCGGGIRPILPLGILDRLRGLVDCGPCGDICGACDEVAVDPCEAVFADDCGDCGPCGGGILPLRGGFFNRLKGACGPCGDVAVNPCDEVAVNPCDPCGC
jgi:hypothetical protein